MPSSRFILRYRGPGKAPSEATERIRSVPGVAIVDAASSRMLLVEGPEAMLREAVGRLADWVIAPEQTVALPDPREKIARRPGKAAPRTKGKA